MDQTIAPPLLSQGLKEWAVAIDALVQGNTIVLLRKGGIRDRGKVFTVPHRQVWLYPTREHQKPHLLKPEYASQVEPVPSGWHPVEIALTAWADITQVFSVQDGGAIAALLPYHIWNETFITERLQWKPDAPLQVLLLRVYRLPHPRVIPYDGDYGGCRSWIELKQPISTVDSIPVLEEAAYQNQVDEIGQVLQDRIEP